MPRDADAVASLYVRAREAAAANASIPPLVHDAADVRRWIGDEVLAKLDCWLAEGAGPRLAGMLVLEGAWVSQLYVEPELTGRGVGGRLLGLAKQERPGGLRLWTFVSNGRAQRFYERHGFSEVRRTDGSGNEERAPDILYAWEPSEA